jgi:hypothetical protein
MVGLSWPGGGCDIMGSFIEEVGKNRAYYIG